MRIRDRFRAISA